MCPACLSSGYFEQVRVAEREFCMQIINKPNLVATYYSIVTNGKTWGFCESHDMRMRKSALLYLKVGDIMTKNNLPIIVEHNE
jgi:hypothetical protein